MLNEENFKQPEVTYRHNVARVTTSEELLDDNDDYHGDYEDEPDEYSTSPSWPGITKTYCGTVNTNIRKSISQSSDCAYTNDSEPQNGLSLPTHIFRKSMRPPSISDSDIDDRLNHHKSYDDLDQLRENHRKNSIPSNVSPDTSRSGNTSVPKNSPFALTPGVSRIGSNSMPDIAVEHRLKSCVTILSPVLDTKITLDSGIEEPSIYGPTADVSTPITYEKLPIFGQNKFVYIKDRYEFDQTKVDEYLNHKLKTRRKLTTKKLSQTSDDSKSTLSDGKPKTSHGLSFPKFGLRDSPNETKTKGKNKTSLKKTTRQ